MRAIVITAPGKSDNLLYTDAPEPKPGPGEVLVHVAYCGCNFADTMIVKGTYPHPKGYPIIGGLEISGTVAKLGEGVTSLRVGDRVAGFSEEAGGFADYCAVPAERMVRLPDAIGLDVGAAFVIQALTAWHMLHNVSTTKAGDVLLVHAVGGGVGLYLTQLAVHAGAKVIGTIGTKGKESKPLAYGASLVINREEEDFVAATLAFTGGRGVDKILDSTGATILDRSFDTIRKLGHIVSIGEAEGPPLPNLWERLVRKSLTFTRLHLGHVDFSGQKWRDGVSEVVEGIAEGRLVVPLEETFPYEQCGAMLERLGSRKVSGKLILAINPV